MIPKDKNYLFPSIKTHTHSKNSPKQPTPTATKKHQIKIKLTATNKMRPKPYYNDQPPFHHFRLKKKIKNKAKHRLHSGLFSLRSGRVRTATRMRKRQRGQTISTTTRSWNSTLFIVRYNLFLNVNVFY